MHRRKGFKNVDISYGFFFFENFDGVCKQVFVKGTAMKVMRLHLSKKNNPLLK